MSVGNLSVKLSVVKVVGDALINPSLWTIPFTVYDESYIVSAPKNAIPPRPFVVLLAARREVEARFLPVVAVDTRISYINYELSAVSRRVDIELHVLARNEAEGDGIVDGIMSVIVGNHFPLYNFPYTPGDPAVATGLFDVEWLSEMITIPEAYMNEGTLKYWSVTRGYAIVP